MDNPDDKRITINVKGVSEKAWETAKKAALKQNETMGSWLSRAIPHLANLEAGPREFPPERLANPETIYGNPLPYASGPTPEHLIALATLAREAREGAVAAQVDYSKAAARRTMAVLRAAQMAILAKPPVLIEG